MFREYSITLLQHCMLENSTRITFKRKCGKSPPPPQKKKNHADFHFPATHIFTECFYLVHISQHNGNYRMIPLYWYGLCIGILLQWHANDVIFWVR